MYCETSPPSSGPSLYGGLGSSSPSWRVADVPATDLAVAGTNSTLQDAYGLLRSSPYFRHIADTFHFEIAKQVLTVRGRVPSFHLKQLLQSVLGKLKGVQRIDNRVDVVSSSGLSSDVKLSVAS